MDNLNALIQDLKNVKEIQRLIDEAYDHYFEHSDGYCKPSEGWVSLDFGNYWHRKQENAKPVAEIQIYSYVFGPQRTHDFATTGEALDTVREWHRRAMAHEYCDEEI